MVEDSENVVCVLFIKYAVRKRHRKNVKDCYSMDSCVCGFETWALPSDSLATTAHFISWDEAILSYILLMSFPCLITL
jgi:hypothetical protein